MAARDTAVSERIADSRADLEDLPHSGPNHFLRHDAANTNQADYAPATEFGRSLSGCDGYRGRAARVCGPCWIPSESGQCVPKVRRRRSW